MTITSGARLKIADDPDGIILKVFELVEVVLVVDDGNRIIGNLKL